MGRLGPPAGGTPDTGGIPGGWWNGGGRCISPGGLISTGTPGLTPGGGGTGKSTPGGNLPAEFTGGPGNNPGGCCISPGGLTRGKFPGGSLPPGGIEVPIGGLIPGRPISLPWGTPVGL